MVSFNAGKPNNSLSLLPPLNDIETKAVLKKCIEARTALAELKVAGDLIPNQTVLINIIPLLEAKDSSEIENIVTTTDRLFQYAFNETSSMDSSTKEALRYRTALFNGYSSLSRRPISTSTAVEVCSHIKGTLMEIRKGPGVALANEKTKQVIYTPPDGENMIRELLKNWESFLHDHTEMDPLVRMAVGHYQFEAIHPFTDGNGRTGRVLNLLFLVSEGLLNQPILYLSRYIIRNKSAYYSLLQGVTESQDWEPWVLYILDGVQSTARWTSEKVAAIKLLMDETVNYVKKNAEKIYTRELVEIIFSQPYCRIQTLIDAEIVQREAAARYLKTLVEIGVLKELKVGRDKIFIHLKLMELLKDDENILVPYQ
ncbi:MAG: Fic family protein [Proteobacteria bacterium]|nr:MAG: Fic family protein [Pseudomonadota bacterium]